MFRSLFAFLGALLFSTIPASAQESADKTAYDFSFTSIDGEPLPLSEFAGKVILVVNTASKCGFTGQYAGLQELYDMHKDAGLVVLGVPSNDFGGQEPGSEAEIKEFCQNTYAVTFPMTEKVSVSGDEAHPFYKWARKIVGWPGAPKWNFHKYVVARDGSLVDYFSSMTAPDSANLKLKLEDELAKPAPAQPQAAPEASSDPESVGEE